MHFFVAEVLWEGGVGHGPPSDLHEEMEKLRRNPLLVLENYVEIYDFDLPIVI